MLIPQASWPKRSLAQYGDQVGMVNMAIGQFGHDSLCTRLQWAHGDVSGLVDVHKLTRAEPAKWHAALQVSAESCSPQLTYSSTSSDSGAIGVTYPYYYFK